MSAAEAGGGHRPHLTRVLAKRMALAAGIADQMDELQGQFSVDKVGGRKRDPGKAHDAVVIEKTRRLDVDE